MANRKCPLCGSQKFFVRNPEDFYDTVEFEFKGGEIAPCTDEGDAPDIGEETETHCCRCTWHGKVASLPKTP
jgi:hypothetical protein